MKTYLLIAALISIVLAQAAVAEPRLILATRSVTIPADGYIKFDVYLYNDSENRLEIPAPESGFSVAWTLRDTNKVRPDRDGSHFVLGTDTVKKYVLKPQSIVRCELGDRLVAENGDVVELFVSMETTTKTPGVLNIRSNSVMLYRARD